MAITYPAPKEHTIESLLGGLVSVPAHIARAQAPDPERDARGVFAEFVNDDNQLAVLAFADLDVVNFVGDAMVGLEVEGLQDASEKAILVDESLEGFREVVNIFASCLNTQFTPHLRLTDITQLPGQLSDEVKQLWRHHRGRRAYRVTVDDFGSGVIILYFT
jgi:hypothetical protein